MIEKYPKQKGKKNLKKKFYLSAFLMIALIISLPFYVAEVYALSLKITKNQGEAGIEGFLKGEGDTWTVEATLTGVEEVNPEEVKIKVGEQEAPFDSCSKSALGISCQYQSFLEGVSEGSYFFEVYYSLLDLAGEEKKVEDGAYVKIDSSPPEITFNKVWQEKSSGSLKIDFSIDDKPTTPCVGLAKVEIIDFDEKQVLETFTDFEEGCHFEKNDALGFTLTGEGKKKIKIKAVDRLGQESSSGFKFLEYDFEPPKILSLELTNLGKFIGPYETYSEVRVNISEKNKPKVKASSEEVAFLDKEGDCLSVGEDLWTCTWSDVKIKPHEVIKVKITAEDDFGNIATEEKTLSLIKDDQKPEVVFFGTSRHFEGMNFIGDEKTRLILKVKEEGVGLDKENLKVNLGSLDGKIFESPSECFSTEEGYFCYWDLSFQVSGSEKEIWLTQFQDKVGNEGEKPTLTLFVDKGRPIVKKISAYGLGEAGKKNYLQGGDTLILELEIEELNGLLILVDLNDLVTEAKEKFPDPVCSPENILSPVCHLSSESYEGWQFFYIKELDNDYCERKEGKWFCSLEIGEKLKDTGYDKSAELNIEIYDTAGNPAKLANDIIIKNLEGENGEYTLEILETSTEKEALDFWEVADISYAPPFIDLDVINLINTRISATVNLKSEGLLAKKIDLVDCLPSSEGNQSAPPLSRKLIYGGHSSSEGEASPIIVLEFEPFDKEGLIGSEEKKNPDLKFSYTCQLKIYSQFGKKVYLYPELEKVNLTIPFGFSELGALDENLEKKIKDIESSVWFKILDVLSYLNDIIKWAHYLGTVVEILIGVNQIVNVINGKFDHLRKSVYGIPIATSVCTTLEGKVNSQIWTFIEYIQIPLQILSCNPDPSPTSWYGKWRKGLIDVLNTMRTLHMKKIVSFYDNLIVSILGLCVPGIIYNLDKLRQAYCYQISCLKNDVPRGIATVKSCEYIKELLVCKYALGEFIASLIPLPGLVEAIKSVIKSFVLDPVGLVRKAIVVTCAFSCPFSNEGASWCDYAAIGIYAIDIINNILSMYFRYPTITQDYCNQIGY